MNLSTDDRMSMVSFLEWALGIVAAPELPGMAPVGDFVLRLDAAPLVGEDVEARTHVKAKVMELLMSNPKKKKRSR